MTGPLFRVVPLDSSHNRANFNSSSESLNNYFKQQVTQDIRRKITACFVLLDENQTIAGYYTLASSTISLSNLPLNISKKLPRYPTIPAVLMGRLAVCQNFKGQGLGGALLADALERSACSEIAAYALMVEAKDSIAKDFYLHHGFISLIDSPLRLFLPLATVR